MAILTSIEFDHADIFADLDMIKASFRRFVSLLPKDGLLIAHLDDPNVAEIAEIARCPVQGYGVSPSNFWQLGEVRQQNGFSHFNVIREKEQWAELTVQAPGQHNCLNSLAVTALLHHIGVDKKRINQGLRSFGGVKRRQEVRGVEGGITVIDDFAHHPTAVRETLHALRGAYPGSRLVVVFEPRTNSSRRSIFQQDYIASFGDGDHIILREPIPLPGLTDHEMFSSQQLADDLNAVRPGVAEAYADTESILIRLETILQKGDVVAILSNGGFDNIHKRLLTQLGGRKENA